VVVGIDEAGEQHPPGKIDDPGLRAAPRRDSFPAADVDDLVSAHGHGFRRRPRGVDRVDQPVLEQPVGLTVTGCGRRSLDHLRFRGESRRKRKDGRRQAGLRSV
jgi:hypothetical protein